MAIPTKAKLAATVELWVDHTTGKWKDSPEEAVEPANIEPMLAALTQHTHTSSGILSTAKALMTLANLCRDPALRESVGDSSAPKTMCELLRQTLDALAAAAGERADNVFLLLQELRSICNMSADNDETRARILKFGGVGMLVDVLRTVPEVSSQPQPIGQSAFAAVLNVSLDNGACTKALVAAGAIAIHVDALRPTHTLGHASELWPIVAASLDNLCESDAAHAHFDEYQELALSMLMALTEHARAEQHADAAEQAQRTLLWCLAEAVEKSAGVRKQLCTGECVLALFDVLEFYLTQPYTADADAEPSALPQSPSRPIPQPADRRANAVTQMIVAVSGENLAIAVLFSHEPLLNRLIAILSSVRPATNARKADGLAAAAATCLGNLARSDANCTQLVAKHGACVRTLIHEWFSDRDVDARARHAASGVLKNLCLPAENKQPLIEAGAVEAAAEQITTAVVPIQANAIGILRHLSNGSGGISAVLRMVECDGFVGALVGAVCDTDIDAIRCEGCRLLANIVKRCYVQSAGVPSIGSMQKATRIVDSCRVDLVRPLVRAVAIDASKHPIVAQEALVALTILASTDADASRHVPDLFAYIGDPVRLELPEGVESDVGGVLRAIMEAGGAQVAAQSWARVSALQAASLVTQLAAQAKDASGTIDRKGIDVVNELYPVAEALK